MSVPWPVAREICSAVGSARRSSPVEVELRDAVGRTLARPLLASRDLPHFASSAMDGWATAGDGPWRLGEMIRTGDRPSALPLQPGWARPICTGAPVPRGAVAVLRAEHGSARDGQLAAMPPREPLTEGLDIRPEGEEARAGELLLPAGRRLTPAALALAAVSGADTVTVYQEPVVGLVLLGSEIAEHGMPPAGRVRDAYGIPLPALLRQHGADPREPVRVADDLDATVAALSSSGGQLVISTGGSSRGETDHVRAALAELDAQIIIDGVGMRPGHPVVLAALSDDRLYLALPGTPLAAMVALITLGLPILDGMLGRLGAALQHAVAGHELPNSSSADVRVLACTLDEGRAVAVPYQGSGMLRGLAAADVLVVVPPGGAQPDEAVQCVPLPW